MPRPARPWYRKSHKMWTVTIDGVQTPLGVRDPAARDAAERVWKTLVSPVLSAPVAVAGPPQAPGRAARDAAAAFLAARCPRVSAACARDYRRQVRDFLAALGPAADGPLQALTAEGVEATADNPRWSDSTRHTYLGTVACLLKWAGHPLRLRRPAKDSRGADSVLTDEQFHMVLGAATGDFRELLRVLRETGARPQEVAPATVEMVSWEHQLLRWTRHKTRRKGVRERVVYFNSAAAAVMERQRAKYRAGLLFRNQYGRAFSAMAVVRRMDTISDRVGFRAIAYGLRHGFATRALVAGVPDAVVAELLGQKGTAMLNHHYSHLTQQAKVLKDAAEAALRGTLGERRPFEPPRRSA